MKRILHILLLLAVANSAFAQCLTKLSSGNYFSYGMKSDGTIWSWGSGVWGQHGVGTTTNRLVPTQLGTLNSWQSFSCGWYYAYAIKTNGTLWGTGDNSTGQLGVGTTTEYYSTLLQIGTDTNWKQVAPSNSFTLGLKTNGTVWAWGQNDTGQMGDGSCCTNRLTPGQMGTDTDWKMVGASGTRTAVAIKNNGTLWGWGGNGTGILGPSNVGIRPFPTQLSPDTNWATVSLGWLHIVALKTDGTLWAWGGGGDGQTGDTNIPAYFRDTPVQIGTATWQMVVAAYRSSFGIKSDGTLWAWGRNNLGQLGDGTYEDKMQPIQIGTDNDWTYVSGGQNFAVAVKSNGALWAWGDNFYGQLGNGTTTANITPTAIPVAGCTLGVENFAKDPLTLYPNPAQGEINISYQGQDTVTGMTIYDLSGRAVYTSNPAAATYLQATLPITELQNGTYILVLHANGKTVVAKRFVKE